MNVKTGDWIGFKTLLEEIGGISRIWALRGSWSCHTENLQIFSVPCFMADWSPSKGYAALGPFKVLEIRKEGLILDIGKIQGVLPNFRLRHFKVISDPEAYKQNLRSEAKLAQQKNDELLWGVGR